MPCCRRSVPWRVICPKFQFLPLTLTHYTLNAFWLLPVRPAAVFPITEWFGASAGFYGWQQDGRGTVRTVTKVGRGNPQRALFPNAWKTPLTKGGCPWLASPVTGARQTRGGKPGNGPLSAFRVFGCPAAA